MRRLSLFVSCVFLSLLHAGCGSDSVHVVPVSGTVKINGQPAEKVGIMFQPLEAQGTVAVESSGTTDARGKFDLRVVISGQRGAMVGTHRVVFVAGEYPKDAPDGAPPVVEPIPPEYNLETTVRFEVPPGGTSEANFDLNIPNFKRSP